MNAVKAGTTYKFNLGIFNETLANAYLLRNGEKVMVEQLNIVGHDNHKDLVLSIRWNRVWGQFKQDVLGASQAVANNAKFNSYFGDVYASLSADLKPIADSIRTERQAVQQDLMQSLGLYVDYYKYYLPQHYQDAINEYQKNSQIKAIADAKEQKDWPLYKRVVVKYNELAERLTSLYLRLRGINERLAKAVPRLPKVSLLELPLITY